VADPTYTYDLETPVGLVRFLISDIPSDESEEQSAIFSDQELAAVLTLERDSVKRAAAQVIDANATNEALASKVIKDHELTTDGAKLADAMRKHAATLRAQADQEYDDSEDGFYFGVIDLDGGPCHVERTQYPYF
jgi:hypothetical protein